MTVQLLNGFPIIEATAGEYRALQKKIRTEKEILCADPGSHAAMLAIAHDMLLHGKTVKAKILATYQKVAR